MSRIELMYFIFHSLVGKIGESNSQNVFKVVEQANELSII